MIISHDSVMILPMILPILQQGQHKLPMHLNGEKMLKCQLKGKTFRKWANGLKIYISENKMDPGLHLPLHWGYIP